MTLKTTCDAWSDTNHGASEEPIARLSPQESLFELGGSLGDSSVPSFMAIPQTSGRATRALRQAAVASASRSRYGVHPRRQRGKQILACCTWDEGRELVMPPEARWEYDGDRECEDEGEDTEVVQVLEELSIKDRCTRRY